MCVGVADVEEEKHQVMSMSAGLFAWNGREINRSPGPRLIRHTFRLLWCLRSS
jgi:hypothetical protein